MLLVHFQGKPFNITVIQEHASTTNAKEAEVEQFYEDLPYLLEQTPRKKKKPHSIIGDWNAKVGIQGISEVTSQYGLGVQNEPRQRLTEFCQENMLLREYILLQQTNRKLCTWTSLDRQCQNQIDYVLCRQKWRSSIQLVKTRPGADCDSGHELIIAKLRLKLKSRENH